MVTPNSEMKRADLIALIAAANTAASAGLLLHGPFYLFDTGGVPIATNDLGAWAAGSYALHDQVTCDGYIFISVSAGNADRPLDATTGDPSANWAQPWHSCYNRMRFEVNSAANGSIESFRQAVSGPWPCQSPSIDYNKLAFYFEDTGSAESVTFSGSVPVGDVSFDGKATFSSVEFPWDITLVHADRLPKRQDSVTGANPMVTTAVTGPSVGLDANGNPVGGQFILTYPTASEISIVVGGTEPISINATFSVSLRAYKGWGLRDSGDFDFTDLTDSNDPLTLFTLDDSDWLPGASFTSTFAGWSSLGGSSPKYTGLINLDCTVNATFSPGTYTLRLAASGGPNNRADGTWSILNNGDGTFTGTGHNEWQYDTFVVIGTTMNIHGTISLVATDAVEVPGIDDTVRILKIAAPEFNATTGVPSGVYGSEAIYEYTNDAPPPATVKSGLTFQGNVWSVVTDDNTPDVPSFVKYFIINQIRFDTITASTDGYWQGITPPVQSLGMLPFDKMPWNIFPTTIPHSGANVSTANQYLGHNLPYVHGAPFDNANSVRAYDQTDSPGWLTLSSAGELLPWPKKWKQFVHYPVGFTIIDSNGNIQECQSPAGRSDSVEPGWPVNEGDITTEASYLNTVGVTQPGAKWKLTHKLRPSTSIARVMAYTVGATGIDTNGNVQKCIVAGTTDPGAPVFATTVGSNTVDGTVTWQVKRINPKLQPPVARISPPIYPFFWHNPVTQWVSKKWALGDEISDTNGNTQQVITAGTADVAEPTWSGTLGGTTNDGTVVWELVRLEQPPLTDPNVDPNFPTSTPIRNPFSFRPQGWCLYRIFLNRIPQKKSTQKPDSTPIDVQLGCVRAGAFVSFGTFSTGTPVDANWFVFTNTALAYECAERLDVQAEILTCGLGYGMWGNISYPMAAAHINDVESILPLLN